ncbi:MAG: twin-arginine translocase subunit TatC [Rubinisphaera brasiliensis]|uniref:Sec-independent protein translocase protein TatC n=1 Tax=Rubinisphaera brasiliensis (strain ATCC 49424 / DSM 5305 / JCM 21570 / IAM 15109 / NBRC 103401 / IFAM 1448) TaxID=756272 RepID=F0SMZ5_RUBBR|nr:twin-arginine translocase subunit TatC [Rubinisphaera brasiliensis]ADY59999.1 Sec-independent protein translocase, TatC subunit [Rubinisphaera brasiliensis DSM 5305]
MPFRSRDLFDDSSMSFGDHLEELRFYLIRALIGVIIVSGFTLAFGNSLVALVRQPIDRALLRHGLIEYAVDDMGTESFVDRLNDWWASGTPEETVVDPDDPEAVEQAAELERGVKKAAKMKGDQISVEIPAGDLVAALHKVNPESFPAPNDPPTKAERQPIEIKIRAPEFSIFRDYVVKSNRPVTLNVQEAFLTYVKVALVCGLVFSSPWIFYNLWMFVAVGLYDHERKFVYMYGTMSLVLFLTGAIFCFFVVFPFVLEFLLSFNAWLEVQPQIRLSEWVSFAVILPLMFGISFQLPLVMVFLNRLDIISETTYREQRRIAILVIAAVSMLLTPSDPTSMLLMMFPLVFLYELGIWLCRLNPVANPFGDEAEPVT